MKTRTLLWTNLIPLCACLLLGLPATTPAQDAPITPPGQASESGFDIAISDGQFVLNGKQTKATLENVVDLLRSRHPEANIVVAPEVPPVLIQNLKIRSTDLGMELQALHVAGGKRFTVHGSGSRDNPLYVLEPVPEEARQRLQVEAFSLTGYLDSLPKSDAPEENEAMIGKKIEELKRMVDETVAIYNDIDNHVYGRAVSGKMGLSMRFHRGANLIILIGDSESVEIASKVIGALPNAQRAGGRNEYYGRFDGFGQRPGGYGTDAYIYGGPHPVANEAVPYGAGSNPPSTTDQDRR